MRPKYQRRLKKSACAKENDFLNVNSSIRNYHGTEKRNLFFKLKELQKRHPGSMKVVYQEIRHACEEQERIVLRQIKHPQLQKDFYQHCYEELKGTKICGEILRIKNMSDEEAIIQFHQEWHKKMGIKVNEDQQKIPLNREQQLNHFPETIPMSFSILEQPDVKFPEIKHDSLLSHHQELVDDFFYHENHNSDLSAEKREKKYTDDDIFEF